MRAFRVKASTFVTVSLLFLSSVASAADDGCETFNVPIFDLSGHFVPSSRVVSCPTSTVDITEAPNAIQSDEVLSISAGRYQQRREYLLRGKPGRSYLFPIVHAADIAASYIADPAYHRLTELASALPFIPYRVVSFDDIGDGHTWYGYTDLRILPSHARDALPLNRNSVVIAVDGFSFRHRNALLSRLSKPDGLGQKRRYVEVVYFQRDEEEPRLKRALIPLSVRSELEPEWSNYAAENHAFDNPHTGLQAIVMAVALSGIIKAFVESDIGRAWARDHEACLIEKAYSSSIFKCL